jgi:hypothetical protein
MASYKRFEDLPIWQEARDFSKQVFWASKEGDFFKSEEISKSISSFIEYLQSSEIKGAKYKSPTIPDQ